MTDYYSDETKTVRLDFNGDGTPDYLLKTAVRCGRSPGVYDETKLPPSADYCGPSCPYVAFVSKPDGTYAEHRLKGDFTFEGNGDSTWFHVDQKRHAIGYYSDHMNARCKRISWPGGVMRETAIKCPS